ncbi:hypothetical protein [Kutzneria albida]|uniref:Uncharacterized protein n=1 Tax=Kutzneria albida DSM 43870 TaxID=1449976 RepID=W5WJG3_9PSEU|nr:hypothetical protein [Kutzneria albida]AHH98304.1 hypothetical protein KALB_4942 [Kutzneria albida DSM 43870]
MTTEDTLRCRRGTHCTNARTYTNTADDGTTRARVPDWATAPSGLCRMDTDTVRRAIEQALADYDELGELLGKGANPLTEPTGGTRELPVPIRLNVEALQAALVDELERWAWPVAERAGTYLHIGGRPNYRARRSVDVLLDSWPALLDLPMTAVMRWSGDARVVVEEDGVDGGLALLGLHDRVEALAGRSHRSDRLWTPCPACSRLSLERQEGDSHINCRRCRHRMTLDDYDNLSRILARAYEHDAA